jgi:hypothetical protein
LDKQRVIEIYQQARQDFKDFVGETPEDYKVLLFIDPELHNSLYQIIDHGGSPHAILSQELVSNLRVSREKEYLPDEWISIYPSKPTMIYLSIPFEAEDSPEREFTLRIMFIHAFAHAYFAEKSESNDSEILTELYRMDMIIKELVVNNAYGLKDEKNIHWGLPYFQDMVAVIRLLSTFGVQDFYVPPESSREVSLFQNFLLEIITYINKRAELIKNKHLTNILTEAFAGYIHREIADKLLENGNYPFNELPKNLKPLYSPPMNKYAPLLLEEAFAQHKGNPQTIIEEVLQLRSDLDLLKKYGSGSKSRELLQRLREESQAKNVYWHSDTGGYWRKTWNIHESEWDRIDRYIKFLNKNQCVNVGEWFKNSNAFIFYGYVKVDNKPIYVFEIDDESISIEQLLILHNHSLLYRQDFQMPTPGFPDVIMFKKLDRMVVGTMLSIGKVEENPISPWDVPTYTRAVDISKQFLDYAEKQKQVAQEQQEKIEQALASSSTVVIEKSRKDVDYSYLKKMSQSKLSAVKVLIDEIVSNQESEF